jgi:hypothetical protein
MSLLGLTTLTFVSVFADTINTGDFAQKIVPELFERFEFLISQLLITLFLIKFLIKKVENK